MPHLILPAPTKKKTVARAQRGFFRPLVFLQVLSFFLLFNQSCFAQTDSVFLKTVTNSRPVARDSAVFFRDFNYYTLSPEKKKKRTWMIVGANVLGYGGVMAGLYTAWYTDYPQTSFHTFNDWPEWKQVDKVGHVYSA